MIIVNILGGLGNQMFQYAFAFALSKKSKLFVKLDVSAFETYELRSYELDLFTTTLETATKEEALSLKYMQENILKKILRKLNRQAPPFASSYYEEPQFSFDAYALKQEGEVYFDGYWQSEKYFREFREALLKEFTLKEELHPQSKSYLSQIKETPSVSLHIRRGDYVSNEYTNSVHGTCSLAYYEKAVETVQKQVGSSVFYIFSDDLVWAKENLSFIEDMIFVELPKEVPDHEEMYLMSQCQHNIIANSSFSWWGAWLNQNEEKIVIAPKKWFNDTSISTADLLPESWIEL